MYNHILVAVDLTEEGAQVVSRALELQRIHSSHLSLVHVVEPVRFDYGNIAINASEIESQLNNASDLRLTGIVEDNALANTSGVTLNGRASTEILSYAADKDVDLIVAGSHGIHGLQLLLGSTVSAILHGTKCDVLAVRIKQ